MNIGWFFRRLYACLLVLALPLLPAGVADAARSKSSIHGSPSSQLLVGSEFGDEAAARGDLGLIQHHRATPDFDQSGSVHLVVDARSNAAKRRGFSPWAGKRTVDGTVVWKRLKFQPWGGKRFARRANKRTSAYFDDSKREFHPWGGKWWIAYYHATTAMPTVPLLLKYFLLLTHY